MNKQNKINKNEILKAWDNLPKNTDRVILTKDTILSALKQMQVATAAELARHFNKRQQHIYNRLRKLEQAGLVESRFYNGRRYFRPK